MTYEVVHNNRLIISCVLFNFSLVKWGTSVITIQGFYQYDQYAGIVLR